MAMSFDFFLSNNASNGMLSSFESDTESGLLSDNSYEGASLLTSTGDYGSYIDAFGGKDAFGTCDLSSMSEFFFSDYSTETAGSIAFDSAETIGSVACAVETAGSVACGGGGFSFGGDSGFGGGGFSSFC